MRTKEITITGREITLQINNQWYCIPYLILSQIDCVSALLRLTAMQQHEREQFFAENLNMEMLKDITECLAQHAGEAQIQSLFKVCTLDETANESEAEKGFPEKKHHPRRRFTRQEAGTQAKPYA
jgi:hypothetical protein